MFHGTITKELTSHEEWRHYNENIIEDQKDFVFVKYAGLHLKTMECLQSCVSLKVCIFANNFVTDIHPLQNCIKLVKLDLHGNQIKILPDAKFWSGLKNLKLLYLHDNGFAKLRNVCMLSACPNLTALTLFDCPVSLKKGYRHVLVNTIWSLKALDHYVISDEEIIQNWVLPEIFKTCSHRLFFNFCSILKKGSTYEDESNNIRYIMSTINEILAHNSPVLIVQRLIRGFLVRKRLSHILLYKRQQEKHLNKARWIYIRKNYEDKLIQDLFIHSETSVRGKFTRWKYNLLFPIDLSYAFKTRKNITPTFNELQGKSTYIKSEAPSHLIRKDQKDSEEDSDKESLATNFRISVFKLPIHTLDSVKRAPILKKKNFDFLPPGAHPTPVTSQKQITEIKDTLPTSNRKRGLLMKRRAHMKLKAAFTIDKQYSEQKKLETHRNKAEATESARVAEERAISNRREISNRKIYAVQKKALKDNEAIQSDLHQYWQDRITYMDKVRDRRFLFLKEKIEKAKDRLLIQTLNNERNMLIKGIIKINKLRKKTDILDEKSRIVRQQREREKYQRELCDQMKKTRAQEACKRHYEEKFVTDMIAFQHACERFQEAKANVALVRKKFNLPKSSLGEY